MMSDTPTPQQLNNQRRLFLLSLLQTRPYTIDEFYVALVERGLLIADSHDQTAMSSAQHAQFRRDLAALRAFGCDIHCDRRSGIYSWCNSPFGISLPPHHLSAFAIVLDTFTETNVPHAADIRTMLNQLLTLLPPEQQHTITSQRRTISIDLHDTSDYRNADHHNIEQIEKAIAQRQTLTFSYRTPRDGKERRHEIEPEPMAVKSGHVYLQGWSIRHSKRLPFRLDYIIPGSAKMGHTPVQHQRSASRPITIRYTLSAQIARNSVSQHFANQQVEPHPDGSATVTAEATNLFEARRILLSYGEHCQALEPAELVAEMRRIAAALHQKYCTVSE